MKLQEMFKQLQTYNEIQKVLCEKEKKIAIDIDDWNAGNFLTFKDFKKYMNKEYIAELTEAVIKLNDLQYEIDSFTSYMNRWGEKREIKVCVYITE